MLTWFVGNGSHLCFGSKTLVTTTLSTRLIGLPFDPRSKSITVFSLNSFLSATFHLRKSCQRTPYNDNSTDLSLISSSIMAYFEPVKLTSTGGTLSLALTLLKAATAVMYPARLL